MSGPVRGRGLFAVIGRNFLDSLRKGLGQVKEGSKESRVGTDPLGNTYYELAADPRRGRRRASRRFEPASSLRSQGDVVQGFDAEIPSEWEAWLRHRRVEPPTDAQVLKSLALADLKKANAAKLELQRVQQLKNEGRYEGLPGPQEHEKPAYPKYDEYELAPGDSEANEAKDRWAQFKNPYLPDEFFQEPKRKN